MQVRRKLIMVALASLALAGAAIASTNQANSKLDCEHPAPLTKARGSDRLDGEYLVTLHHDHDLLRHFGHIRRSSQVDPFVDWEWKWFENGNGYYVVDLTEDSVNHIRCDPGVRNVSENEMWAMDLVEPLRNGGGI